LILLAALLVRTAAADPQAGRRFFVPIVAAGAQGTSASCDLPRQNFGRLTVQGSPQQGDQETDSELNLAYRGYAPTQAALKLIVLGPVVDSKAPQLPGLFADRRTARMSAAYQRYRWDESCDCPAGTHSPWDVTVLGLAARPAETIHTPDTTIDIGSGYAYQVMYAGENTITLYVGRDDDFHGYVVHLDGVCVDPDLLQLYRKLDAAGRKELPALRAHEAFGQALGGSIKVAVRDSGHFLDPRSRNDWWQGR